MAEKNRTQGLYYRDYLQLDRLLSSQSRESERQNRPAHDEMLFITIHQAYELWFKQVLFELDAVTAVFAADRVDDRAIAAADRGLGRIQEILRLLVAQVEILETMTPLDFLDFRDLLYPASGFQSLQFRLIETRLGLPRAHRLEFDQQSFDQRLDATDRKALQAAEANPTLADQIQAWLERTPFVDSEGWSFEGAFRGTVGAALQADMDYVRSNPNLDPDQRNAELARLDAARTRFNALFDQAAFAAARAAGQWRFSRRALQAALFIILYRDEPVLHLPFRLLSHLMDIDETLTAWRHRHALMVQRMIGLKLGTGGSSGGGYLKATADSHQIFTDLFALSTYLIPRSQLPPLPEALRARMGFTYDTGAG